MEVILKIDISSKKSDKIKGPRQNGGGGRFYSLTYRNRNWMKYDFWLVRQVIIDSDDVDIHTPRIILPVE